MARPRTKTKKAAKTVKAAKAKVVLAKKLKKVSDKSLKKLTAVITEPAPSSRVLTEQEIQTQTSRALSPDPTVAQPLLPAPVTFDIRKGTELGRDIESARANISILIDKWAPRIIPDWTVDVEWIYDRHAIEPGCLMETKPDWTRCQGTIVVYLLTCAVHAQHAPSFEPVVVHELLHFAVSETQMWREFPDCRDAHLGMVHEERVVTMLTRAIMDLIGADA